MAEARQHERWNHTAALLALLANVHRDPRRRRPVTPAELHPLRQAAVPRPVGDLSILKAVFVDRRNPQESP